MLDTHSPPSLYKCLLLCNVTVILRPKNEWNSWRRYKSSAILWQDFLLAMIFIIFTLRSVKGNSHRLSYNFSREMDEHSHEDRFPGIFLLDPNVPFKVLFRHFIPKWFLRLSFYLCYLPSLREWKMTTIVTWKSQKIRDIVTSPETDTCEGDSKEMTNINIHSLHREWNRPPRRQEMSWTELNFPGLALSCSWTTINETDSFAFGFEGWNTGESLCQECLLVSWLMIPK